MQLNFSPWKIEQDVFDPSAEPELQQQLAISNGYISENACFDEHYSGEARPNVYLRDVATPLILPPVLSVRLHEERMDLSTWKIESFYRCQYRQEPKLERSFLATSPSGATFKVKSLRWMDPEHEQVVHREYEVESVDYTGPVSFLSLIGGVMDDWYPLAVEATPEHVAFWLQCRKENVRLAMASKFSLLKNGAPITRPFIRIEKRSIGGFSITEQVRPGDVYVLHRTASVVDSRNFPSPHLLADAVALL